MNVSTQATRQWQSLDDLIERTLPANLYVPARVKLLKILGKGEPEAELVKQLLPRGGRAIDIGANKGTYAKYLLDHFDVVEAFEPIPSCAELLKRYSSSRGSRLSVHECALGSTTGSARLSIPQRSSPLFSKFATAYAKIAECGAVDDADGQSFAVSLRRLDDFSFEDVRFVKIDVEGFEREVILGALQTIDRHRPTLLVEIEKRHLNAVDVADIVHVIVERGYQAKFFADGRLRDFSEFDVDYHQVTAANGTLKSNRGRYINNFFFLPR